MNMFEEACNELDEEKKNPKNSPSFLVGLACYAIAIPIGLVFLVFEGFIIMSLWNWFLVGLTGITMTLLGAIAIDFIGAIITFSPKKRSTYETFWGMWQIIKVNVMLFIMGWGVYILFVS